MLGVNVAAQGPRPAEQLHPIRPAFLQRLDATVAGGARRQDIVDQNDPGTFNIVQPRGVGDQSATNGLAAFLGRKAAQRWRSPRAYQQVSAKFDFAEPCQLNSYQCRLIEAARP